MKKLGRVGPRVTGSQDTCVTRSSGRHARRASARLSAPGALTPALLLWEADRVAQKGSEPLGPADLPSVRPAPGNTWYSGFPRSPWPFHLTVENLFPVPTLSLNTHTVFQVKHIEGFHGHPSGSPSVGQSHPFPAFRPPPAPGRSARPGCLVGASLGPREVMDSCSFSLCPGT